MRELRKVPVYVCTLAALLVPDPDHRVCKGPQSAAVTNKLSTGVTEHLILGLTDHKKIVRPETLDECLCMLLITSTAKTDTDKPSNMRSTAHSHRCCGTGVKPKKTKSSTHLSCCFPAVPAS